MIHRGSIWAGRRVVEVMTPRHMIFSLPIDTPRPSIWPPRWRAAISPACQSTGRSPTVSVGILHAKDVVGRRMDRTPARIERLMRPPYFVPPAKLWVTCSTRCATPISKSRWCQ